VVRVVGQTWRSLTVRGRGLIIAGVTCIAAGEFVGERDLLRVGVLLIVLPFAAWVIVARARYRMRLERILSSSRVQVDSPARVVLRLTNVSSRQSDTLFMEEALPYALGGRPRFVVSEVEANGVREATYTVRSQTRGRHRIGPLTVRIGDPFGCVELTRAFHQEATLTVSPKVIPLPAIRADGDGVSGGEGSASQAAVTGEADIATREHRHGDDLRKVHWRSTAKRGQLMVRRDEQPRQNRATLLLDTRLLAYSPEPLSPSFEWAVSASASIGVWLCRQGYATQLITSAGTVAGGGSPSAAETALLDTLALVDRTGESGLHTFARRRAQESGLLVAVTPLARDHDVAALAHLSNSARTAIAIVMDADGWHAPAAGHGPEHDARRRDLAAHGWRVITATAADTIDELWPRAARTPDAAASR